MCIDLYVCLCFICVPGAHRGQEKVSGPLELDQSLSTAAISSPGSAWATKCRGPSRAAGESSPNLGVPGPTPPVTDAQEPKWR